MNRSWYLLSVSGYVNKPQKIILQDRVAKYAETLQPWIKDKNTFNSVSIILFLALVNLA